MMSIRDDEGTGEDVIPAVCLGMVPSLLFGDGAIPFVWPRGAPALAAAGTGRTPVTAGGHKRCLMCGCVLFFSLVLPPDSSRGPHTS